MAQQQLNINQQLAYLMSTGKWRNCQRKQYNIFAILPKAGYVFANRLEQPKEFKYIYKHFGRAIVSKDELTPQQLAELGNNCYVTDGQKLVLCGTRGEMWTVKPDKFISSYVKLDGSKPDKVPTEWTEFSRAPETAPSAKGIQIPADYLGIYDAGWGVLYMNDPESPGHYKGDILVVSNDGQSISTVNNEVFALTFNQNIGGWAQSGCIVEPAKIKPLSLDFVKKTYQFISKAPAAVGAPQNRIELLQSVGNHYTGERVFVIHVDENCQLVESYTFEEAKALNFETAADCGIETWFTAEVYELTDAQRTALYLENKVKFHQSKHKTN